MFMSKQVNIMNLRRFSLLFLVAPMISIASKIHPAAQIHRGLNDEYINCVVYQIGGLAITHHEEINEEKRRFSCSSENFGPTVLLDGDYDAFFTGEKQIIPGETSLIIPTNIVSSELSVDLNDPLTAEAITVLNSKRTQGRALRGTMMTDDSSIANNSSKKRGSYSVLVVRVSDSHGNSPTYNAKQISDSIFNGYVSLATGYQTCSNSHLYFYKTSGGKDVNHGVVDVEVSENLSNAYDSSACVNAADNLLSTSEYDVGDTHSYTMYICPDVVKFGQAAGVAQMGGTKSWFKDTWGSVPFVQMHEIGHNLRFFHSREGVLEYGDPTGFMGGAFEREEHWGRMCLNAAKTYESGWYSEYNIDIDPELRPYIGSMVDVNSVYQRYIKEGENVVAHITNKEDKDMLYAMLHRLEGITSDMVAEYVPTHANRVNIVSQSFAAGVPSKAVAQLASGEEYIQQDWAGTGKALHIKVCSIAEHSSDGGAKVIVYLEGQNFVSCNMEVAKPPTPSPSLPPSRHLKPTKEPTTIKKGGCVDSELRILLPNKTKRNCEWVAAKSSERCLVEGVASHCPQTCGTCIECIDASRKFRMNFGEMKSCSWVKKNNTKSRCAMKGVKETCRATCESCSS